MYRVLTRYLEETNGKYGGKTVDRERKKKNVRGLTDVGLQRPILLSFFFSVEQRAIAAHVICTSWGLRGCFYGMPGAPLNAFACYITTTIYVVCRRLDWNARSTHRDSSLAYCAAVGQWHTMDWEILNRASCHQASTPNGMICVILRFYLKHRQPCGLFLCTAQRGRWNSSFGLPHRSGMWESLELLHWSDRRLDDRSACDGISHSF